MNRKTKFIELFKKVEKKYGANKKRLAGEGWKKDWELLFAVMLSAQSKDEITILVAENFFKEFNSLEKIANAKKEQILKSIKKINYNKTKAENIKKTAKILLEKYKGKVPNSLQELMNLPGVGIKTANLVLSELFKKDAICVDTHVHRLMNIFNIVNTKTPEKTEQELKKIVPKKYWSKINRLFVLWGQDAKGKDSLKLLQKLK